MTIRACIFSGAARRLLQPVFIVVALACRADAEGTRLRSGTATEVPAIVLADSVELNEPDSLPLGPAVGATRDAAGFTYLTDFASSRVMRFDSTGTLSWSRGRRGGGPTEFRGPDVIAVLPGDSLLAVVDGQAARIAVLAASDGSLRRHVRMPFVGAGRQWLWSGDTATFAVQANSKLLARWATTSDSIWLVGEAPSADGASGFVALQYGFVEVAPDGDGYVAQLPASRFLLRLDRSGAVRDRWPVPARVRAGQPDDLLARHARMEANKEPFRFLGSLALALGRTEDGALAVLQADLDPSSDPVTPRLRYYVTILTNDGSRACVDGVLPLTTDALMPPPAFISGRIVALSRTLDASRGVRVVWREYRIDTSRCRWEAISRR